MKILVVYYSMTGNVAALAEAIAEGARTEGAEIRVRQVTELMPEEVINKRPALVKVKEKYRHIPIATNEDLEWADGVAFGSPTRYGNMTAQLKEFIDQTGKLWMSGSLTGKLASVFTSTSTQHGGQESTLISMMIPLFHLGFIIQGFPYAEQLQMGMEAIHGGSPYGVSSISGPTAERSPQKQDLEMAAALGKRLVQTARKLRRPVEQAEAA
ncbi:MAG TPA: NAD(P)H:quinone oxidoreductase [Bdellovibrionales bacterium]|nr:MAG: NAD(P)H:quinone oxidoreductase, type IV [Bdellovibrionales bacterium GWB1_52_6]OFZ05599.1 MAG: NAD(P)H:quinone oxidoreductase, type IV [Bdellovibrionales bacterium GWA1_52_35]OFZ32813.1 MAG: NAD(P)H:quinone oxidoreductase, type IV [Bdellovibrionales bacterium GWC1_52_8]HAR44055.1 NAD(P)H:quinone oxidoreductase [Bdellovibrionales bacterium]HCM41681.1 NAD(P)H:quinone oxidoreductase [Bdellovibrionales bacterium]